MSNILMVGDEPVGQVGYFTEQESIAPVVESPTTSAISSGSHFMYNGVRMVATSAIASGATLVVYPTTGYNCKTESVEDKLDDLSTDSVTFTPEQGVTVVYNSTGINDKLVGGSMRCLVTGNADSWINIGTISKAPFEQCIMPFSKTADGTYGGMVEINPNGVVRAYLKSSFNGASFAFTFSYKTT